MKLLVFSIFIMISPLSVAGEFKAGISTVAITPVAHRDVVRTLEAGPKVVGNISDPLYAKTLVISDGQSRIVLITLDLMYLPSATFAELLNDLREKSAFDQIFLSITHSHSGYVGNDNYDALKEKLTAGIKTANANLQTVKIGAAEGTADEAYNRIIRRLGNSSEMLWTNPDRGENRAVDQAVGVINFKKSNGETLVNIVNYSAHPVITMDLTNVVISADYPGHLADSLKRSGEGETLFFLGAAGDVNPYHANTKPTSLALDKSKELGEKLAAEVVKSISSIKDYQTQGRFSFNNLRYALPVIKESEQEFSPAEINTLLLTDDIALASFSGEFFNQFGVVVKQQSPSEHTFFAGYTNGSLGYIPTKEAAQFGGYGADSNDMWFEVETGEKLVKDAIESLKGLHKARSAD